MIDVEAFLSEISARLISADAAALPQPAAAPDKPMERAQVMTFLLGSDRYAIDIHHASEIIRHPRITPVPGLIEWVLGVTNLHGEVLSVVDLARFLSLTGNPAGESSVLIVASAVDQKIGLAVDDIGLIVSFPLDALTSPPFEVPDQHIAYLRGVVDHQQEFVRVLDCERLLLGQHMQQFG
jgi:purine-binding chemotaxis protein CheW